MKSDLRARDGFQDNTQNLEAKALHADLKVESNLEQLEVVINIFILRNKLCKHFFLFS